MILSSGVLGQIVSIASTSIQFSNLYYTKLASDDFNRANETPLSNGGKWTNNTGNSSKLNLSSNSVTSNAATDATSYWNSVSWPNDQYSQVTATGVSAAGNGSGYGVVLRMASSTVRDGYFLVVDSSSGNNMELYKYVSSTYTHLIYYAVTYTDGAIIRLEAVGTNLTSYYNGVKLGTVSDSSIASGNAGVAYSSTETTGTADNWEGGSIP